MLASGSHSTAGPLTSAAGRIGLRLACVLVSLAAYGLLLLLYTYYWCHYYYCYNYYYHYYYYYYH